MRDMYMMNIARAATDRTALGKRHEYLRCFRISLSAIHATADTLLSVLGRLVEPYRSDTEDRISVRGDDLIIGRSAATAIALIVHELATNAVKYGALSTRGGRVRISVINNLETTSLRWVEDGGPTISTAPIRRGFGSVLVDRAAKSQLGARLDFDWHPAGVIVTVVLDQTRLTA